MSPLSRRQFLATGAAVGALTLVGCSTDDDSSSPPSDGPPGGALADLSSRLSGTLLLPGDDGYDSSSQSKNGRYGVTRPVAVAEVADAEDVATCVTWCTENGVSPVARGGGHSYAGFSTTVGLIISLAKLDRVDLDPSSGTATVGGSALNRDVFDAAVGGDWILPAGTCLQVGVGGLTLGGGIGYNTHWAGLTSDHLTSSQIVTADGEIRTISESEDPDLFWACRGGAGGSFGVNTELTFQLVEVPADTVAYYDFKWRGAEAAGAVLAAFDEIMQTAPDALSAVAWAEATEVGSGGPREAIDVESRGLFIGSSDELADLVQPLVDAAGEPTDPTLQDQDFWQTQQERTTEESPLHSWGDISRYARGLVPAEAYAQQAELLAECPQRSEDANGSMWALGWVGGGVVGRFGRTETAYVHRDATNLLRPTVVWPADADPSVGDELEDWALDMLAIVEPHTPAESYQNFPNRLIDDWPAQYYAENWDRLIDVKTDVDPENLFNNPQSIPPNPLS